MKTRIDRHIKVSLLIFSLISCCFVSCKKENEPPAIIGPDSYEHLTEIIGLKGGLEDYREVYYYDGGKLSEYYVYRYAKDGSWKEWLRYSYDYPSEDMIIETREGVSDSVWFKANKYEKKFIGEDLSEICFFEYDAGLPDHWRPLKKIGWILETDRPVERVTWIYQGSAWEQYQKSLYEYEGTLWTGLKTYRYIDGTWDTVGCMALVYQGGKLSEVDVYECHHPGGWTHNEQYLLNYTGSMISEMKINTREADSLAWERTIFVEYDENGLPAEYIIDFECCPTELIQMTYESGKGNFQRATRGVSDHIFWPWFPAPEKKME